MLSEPGPSLAEMKFLMLMWSEHDASGGEAGDIAAWAEFDQAAREAGVRVDGAALEPAKTAAAVVTPEIAGGSGADAIAAGPFTSGASQIEAYYLLDCRDVAEAHAWARRLPTYGRVEVRPLLEYDVGD
jgi:hypothetical protein